MLSLICSSTKNKKVINMNGLGLAQIKREGAYYIGDVEVTKAEYSEHKKQHPSPFSKYYELRYEDGGIIDTVAFNKAVSAIRVSQTDKHDLIAAIAHEILNNEGY